MLPLSLSHERGNDSPSDLRFKGPHHPLMFAQGRAEKWQLGAGQREFVPEWSKSPNAAHRLLTPDINLLQ